MTGVRGIERYPGRASVARTSGVSVTLLCVLYPLAASGQGGAPDGDEATAAQPTSAAAAPAAPAVPIEERLAPLQARIEKLEQELAALREEGEIRAEDDEFRDQRMQRVARQANKLSGYIDVGFFWVNGDGSGLRVDTGNRVFPEYDYVTDGWVFMGDPLSTAINARGDPADTGDSRALATDTIDAADNPTFIVNTLALSVFHGLTDNLSMEATLWFMPRNRDVSRGGAPYLSQFFDLPRAYVEYVAPFRSFDLHLYAGKFDSVLGFEYRSQDAPDRITVTPSLICRYICGHPLGLKARALFLDNALVVNAAVTNGSHVAEVFPFRDELDSNSGKTLAARLSYRWPVGTGLEIGVSGSYGAQDLQRNNGVRHRHVGVDLSLEWNNLIVRAEYHDGLAPGATDDPTEPCDLAPCLDYKGAYGLLAYRLKGGLIPYARVDWREADHLNGRNFVYISRLVRTTAGLRKEIGPYLITKLEYTLNLELGPLPQADNNVLTSSLVVRY